MKIVPHNYQIRACRHCLENAIAALFLDLGLGKTVIVLTAIHNLIRDNLIKGVLVLAPLRVVYNVWPSEILKWDHLQHLSCGIAHGPKKADVLKKKHDIYLLNYEGLPWLIDQLRGTPPGKWPFDMIVFDESTAVKNSTTKRFKMLKSIVGYFERRVILTGTPAPNSLLDIWAQYFMLDEGERLGKSYYWFKQSYFRQADYWGYRWEPRTKSVEELSEKVADITIRLRASDYLEMPKLFTNQTIWSMSPKIIKQYADYEKDYLIELQEETFVAVNAAALSTKLRQFVSGFQYKEDRTVTEIHKEKVETLSEIIEGNSSENVLVAIQFRHEYEMIKKKFKDVPVIYGGMNQRTTKTLIDKWNRGELPMLVVHPASIAHGVNLQEGGRMLIWYGIPWSWEHYSQMVGRLHRQGQKKPVINTFIVAKDTVENDVIQALETKEENEASFLQNLVNALRSKYEKTGEGCREVFKKSA